MVPACFMSRSAAAREFADTATELYEQAMTLPQSERRALANRLLDSLEEPADDGASDAEVERAWTEEAVRRQMVPWDEAALRAAINEGVASGVAEGDPFAWVRARLGIAPHT